MHATVLRLVVVLTGDTWQCREPAMLGPSHGWVPAVIRWGGYACRWCQLMELVQKKYIFDEGLSIVAL